MGCLGYVFPHSRHFSPRTKSFIGGWSFYLMNFP
jgi:hypothetical protein